MSGLIPPTRAPGDDGPHDEPHLLAWEEERRDARPHVLTADLSRSELDVLEDAANGMTTRQSAFSRSTAFRASAGLENGRTPASARSHEEKPVSWTTTGRPLAR